MSTLSEESGIRSQTEDGSNPLEKLFKATVKH